MSDRRPTRWITRLRGGTARLPGNIQGALWVLAASLVFSVQGVIVKHLGQALDIFQIQFFRCAVGFVVVLSFLLRGGGRFVSTERMGMHFMRAIVGLLGMACGFYAVTHLPLAEATALTFTKPLFMIVLAVLFLGEVVRWRRWTATMVGFLGVVVILRPGEGVIQTAALVGLLGSLFIADVGVLIKKLSATERTVTVLFYFTLISTVISAIPAAFVWRGPTIEEIFLLSLLGITATFGQALTMQGFRVAEATAIMPFDYSRLLYAASFGYFFFAEIPDTWTWVGAAIIAGSTLYIGYREAKAGRAPGPGFGGG